MDYGDAETEQLRLTELMQRYGTAISCDVERQRLMEDAKRRAAALYPPRSPPAATPACAADVAMTGEATRLSFQIRKAAMMLFALAAAWFFGTGISQTLGGSVCEQPLLSVPLILGLLICVSVCAVGAALILQYTLLGLIVCVRRTRNYALNGLADFVGQTSRSRTAEKRPSAALRSQLMKYD